MLTHYAELLRHFWKVVLAGAIGTGVLAYALSMMLLQVMPLYKSSVTLNMQPSEEALVFNRNFQGVSQFNPSAIITQTHVERLLSRDVAERALDILVGQNDGTLPASEPNAFDRVRAAFWKNWNELNYGFYVPPTLRQQQINSLMEATSVEIVEGSYILVVEVTYDNPRIAAEAADALARAYIEQASLDFAADAASVDETVSTMLARKQQQLADAVTKRREKARSLDVTSIGSERVILFEARRQALQQLGDSELQLQLLETRVANLKDSIAQTTGTAAIERLREELEQTEADLVDMQARIEFYRRDVSDVQASLVNLDRAESELAEYDADIREIETDISELQGRQVEIELSRNAKLSHVRVIEDAKVPVYPAFPKVLVNTVVGTILGAILALLPVFAIDVLSDRVRTTEDLRQSVGGRVLPKVSRRLARQARRFNEDKAAPSGRLKYFADILGRRFLTMGRHRWPQHRIYVTAFGDEEDVARLRDTVEAAVRLVAPVQEDGSPIEVVALPEIGRLDDWSAYSNAQFVIGVHSGSADRAEVSEAEGSASAEGAEAKRSSAPSTLRGWRSMPRKLRGTPPSDAFFAVLS